MAVHNFASKEVKANQLVHALLTTGWRAMERRAKISMNVTQKNLSINVLRIVRISLEVTSAYARKDLN